MTGFELINTEWFDADAIRLPNYQVGRVSFGRGRSYIRIQDGQLESPFRLYTSLTTAISTCAPMEKSLLEWHCKLGMAEAERYTRMSADYGTLMHLVFGEFLRNQYYDFAELPMAVNAYVHERSLVYPEIKYWHKNLTKDLAAFAQFCYDYEVKPLGIEYVLLSNKGFGTLIDLVCKMKIREAKGSRNFDTRTCIINFKSGKHGFYRNNGIQVSCEAQLFHENFPDIQIQHSFNWSPKDWETSPTYNLKDWTGEISDNEIDCIINLAQERYATKAINKQYIEVGGTAYAGRPLDDCITKMSVEDYCKQVYSDYL